MEQTIKEIDWTLIKLNSKNNSFIVNAVKATIQTFFDTSLFDNQDKKMKH